MKQLEQLATGLTGLEVMLVDQPQAHQTINLLKQTYQSLVKVLEEPFTITVEGGVVTEVEGSVQVYVVEDLD